MKLRSCALAMALAVQVAAADWPQWRGPNRDGIAAGVTLPESFPESLKSLWSVEVGAGHSSPVIVGDRVVVLVRQDEREVLLGLNSADGREAWRSSWDAPYEPNRVARAHGKGPFATPTIADGRVYVHGITGTFAAHDLDTGKPLWRVTPKGSDKSHPTWGIADSVLVEGDMAICAFGSQKDGGLIALDSKTGRPIWKQAADGAGYASAIAVDLAGRRQVVTLLFRSAVGIDARTGKLAWKHPFAVQYEQNVSTPVIHGGRVVISGWQLGTVAVDPDSGAAAWTNKKCDMYLTSGVQHEGYLYGMYRNGGGTLFCLSLANGQTAWTSPGQHGANVSIVRVGDRLLVLTTKGKLLVVAADPREFRELANVQVSDRPVWAHLAITPNRLLIKDKTHLTCFGFGGS